MITAINSSNSQKRSNPSFGIMSPDLERFVKTPKVRKKLIKAGLDKSMFERLYKSPIKISFLKDLFEPLSTKEANLGFVSIPDTAGLVVLPPRGSHLPNLCVTADDANILEAGIDSFAFSLKKAVELVDSYKVGRVALNNRNRPLKVRKIDDLHGLENAINSRLKSVPNVYNYGGGEEAITPLLTEINHINKLAFLRTHKYDVERARNGKELMAVVRNEWLGINARRFDVSA